MLTMISLLLMLQDVAGPGQQAPIFTQPQPQLQPIPVIVQENNGRRDLLLSIIAGAVTITITLGPILINRWMDKLKDERELAAKVVADAAALVAMKAQVVAEKVEEVKNVAAATSDGIAALQVTADSTHHLVDGRYSEIRDELKLSNENNRRMTLILIKAGILPPDATPTSGTVAEPAHTEEPIARRAEDLALLQRRSTDREFTPVPESPVVSNEESAAKPVEQSDEASPKSDVPFP